jgi:hypothetical protein
MTPLDQIQLAHITPKAMARPQCMKKVCLKSQSLHAGRRPVSLADSGKNHDRSGDPGQKTVLVDNMEPVLLAARMAGAHPASPSRIQPS